MSSQIDPDRDAAIAFYNEGCMLVNRKSFEMAKQKFEQALEKNPNYTKAWYNRALAAHHLGQLSDTKESLEMVVKLDPSNLEAWKRLGVVCANLDHYADALNAFETILEIEPENAAMWSNKGVMLTHLERYDDALSAFDQAITLDELYSLAHYNTASVYAIQNEVDLVIENLRNAMQASNKIDWKQKIRSDKDFSHLFDNEKFVRFLNE